LEITEKVVQDITKRVTVLLREYQSDMDHLYDEEGKVKVSMPIEISSKNNSMLVKVGFRLVTGKIDDSSTGFIRENDPELPFEETPDNKFLCPAGKGTVETAQCDHCELRYELMESEPDEAGEILLQGRSCSVWSDHDTKENIDSYLRRIDREDMEKAETQPEAEAAKEENKRPPAPAKKKGKKAA